MLKKIDCNSFNVNQFVNNKLNKTSHLHPPPADNTGVIHGIAHRVCLTKTLHRSHLSPRGDRRLQADVQKFFSVCISPLR